MVPYLLSTETPYNWNKILEHSTEYATEQQQQVPDKWLYLQTNQEDQESDNVPNPGEAISQQEANSPVYINEKNTKNQISDTTGENKKDNNTLVNFNTMGLRHSGRISNPSTLLK